MSEPRYYALEARFGRWRIWYDSSKGAIRRWIVAAEGDDPADVAVGLFDNAAEAIETAREWAAEDAEEADDAS